MTRFASLTIAFFFALPSPAVLADDSAEREQAYSVLQRFGLLNRPLAPEPQPKIGASVVMRMPGQAYPDSNQTTSDASAPLNATAEQQRNQRFRPPERRVDRVLVDKSERRLQLIKNGETIREYPVQLSKRSTGHKLYEGDLRTPEGTYTIDWRNPESRYHKSLHISYPNEADRARAQELGVEPGGMIMVHGEHYMQAMANIYRRVKQDWTEGCIAMLNEHIDEIWELVEDGTPIEIRP